MKCEQNRILVAVCGSIAAYKAVELVRQLQRDGWEVQVLMTHNATRFVGKATFEGLTQRPVYTGLFDESLGEVHVELARQSSRLLVAAATADTLSRLANGRADDLLSATALCYSGLVYVAPAMHPRMWAHPATQRNVARLKTDGVRFLGPVDGVVASGDEGLGRMMEPSSIAAALSVSRSDLTGRRIVVTAGPTVEDLDPIRFLSNRSTGRMGYAIAERARQRGAEVRLVSGPVHLAPPPQVTLYSIRSAVELLATLRQLCTEPTDAVIMTAAVGDFRARTPSQTKLKRAGDISLELVENPDIIRTLALERRGTNPLLVAFALETGDDATIIEYAREKLSKKGVDLVVANRAEEALGTEDNRVHLVRHQGCQSLPRQSKAAVADAILDTLLEQW